MRTALLLSAVLAYACETRGVPTAAAESPIASDDVPDYARGCLLLRDVAASDVVRVDGSTLYYLDEGSGLSIVDVSDPDRPLVSANVPHVGSPLRLFVREGVAWVVFVDSDRRFLPGAAVSTVIRAVDVREPSRPRVLGTIAREGVANDATLVGGFLYLLRESGPGAVVESFGVRSGKLSPLDRRTLDGRPVQLAASSAGLAAVTARDARVGVAWVDLPTESLGTLAPHGALWIDGGLPKHVSSHVVDADDGLGVEILTCQTGSCSVREGSRLHTLDFGADAPKLVRSTTLSMTGGLPETRFADERLYLSTTAEDATSELRVVTRYPVPVVAGVVHVRGAVTMLAPRPDGVVALAQEPRGRLVVHDIDARRASNPHLRASIAFGEDWTWSPAELEEAAMSFDPASRVVTFPFTSIRAASGVKLVDLGAKRASTIASDDYVIRAVFVDGRLLTVGPDGVRPAARRLLEDAP